MTFIGRKVDRAFKDSKNSHYIAVSNEVSSNLLYSRLRQADKPKPSHLVRLAASISLKRQGRQSR